MRVGKEGRILTSKKCVLFYILSEKYSFKLDLIVLMNRLDFIVLHNFLQIFSNVCNVSDKKSFR